MWQLHLDLRTPEHAMAHNICSELRLELHGDAVYTDQLEPCHRTKKDSCILETFIEREIMGESGQG